MLSQLDCATALRPNLSQSTELQLAAASKIIRQSLEGLSRAATETERPNAALLAISCLDRTAPKDLMSLLLHPAYRYWLQGLRRTTKEEFRPHRGTFVESIGSFWWQELRSSTLTDEVHTRLDNEGGLRCLPAHRYFEFGRDRAQADVTIRFTDGHFRVTFTDGLQVQIEGADALAGALEVPLPTVEVEGYSITDLQPVGPWPVEVSGRDLFLRVALTGTNQRATGTEFFGVDGSLYDVRDGRAQVSHALYRISDTWPEWFAEFGVFTSTVLPIALPSHLTGAFTVSSRQGAIYIGDGTPDESIDMLLHENAHVKLRQIQLLDTLLEDPLDEAFRVSVPWRPDPRPVPGILEGLYVFAHVAEYAVRESRSHAENRAKASKLITDLFYAYDVLDRNAKLTSVGRQWLAGMYEWICELKRSV